MTRELRHGAVPRLLTVVAVLLGLFFMHGLSGSVSDAAPHHDTVGTDAPSMGQMSTTAYSRVAPAGVAEGSALAQLTAFDAWAPEQPDRAKRSGMVLTGLCLAFLTSILLGALVAARLRPWGVLGGGTWWPVLLRPLPARCRAPNLFALGVLRC